MKVLQVTFSFYPDPVGGTEVYVASLGRDLARLGAECVIAAPSASGQAQSYQHDKLKVRRFPVAQESREMLLELYGKGDPHAAARFGMILDEEKPDVVHLHAFTRGLSLLLAREATRRSLPLVFTYHTPTVSCQRGTLLRYGRERCDGRLDLSACTRCTLDGLGVNAMGSGVLSAIPPRLGQALGALRLAGGPWTALRMSELIRLRHETFHELMGESAAIVALCDWTRELLLLNGVPQAKITLSRQGLPHAVDKANSDTPVGEKPTLRLVFLGRTDPTKGPDTLVRAIRSEPDASVRLDLYGIVQDRGHEKYCDELKRLAAGDPRISFFAAVASGEVPGLLKKYDALAVPSRWLETGPLVVLEAFAAGIPVIGSNLGGIAELVEHGVNGLLVEPDSVEAWSKTIRRCRDDRDLIERLRRGIRPPRTMNAVAEEMLIIYGCLLGERRSERLGDSRTHDEYRSQA